MALTLFRRVQLRELRPRAQATPNNTVAIEPGIYTKSDGTGFVRISTALSSAAFPAVSSGKTRYDLLCLDNSGAVVITSGTEVNSPGDPIANAPLAPTDKLSLGIIRIDETGTVVVDGSDITDVREFMNKGGGSAPAFDTEVNQWSPDDTYPAVNTAVGGIFSAVGFPYAANAYVYGQFLLDGRLSVTKDIRFDIKYAMSSAETSKKFTMKADIWILGDTDDPAAAANYTALADEITARDDSKMAAVTLTNIKVASAGLTSAANHMIAIRLWRDVAASTPAHSGDVQLVSVRAYQV